MTKLSLAALSLLLVSGAIAGQGDPIPGVDVSVDARVNYAAFNYGETTSSEVSVSTSSPWYDTVYADDINVTLTADLAAKVRAVLRMNLARLFECGSVSQKLERALEEATIEVRDINGTPVAAVIFGKKQVFGDLSNKDLAGYRDSLLYDLFTVDQVIGLTVKLKDILGIALEASAFENRAGDLQFGDGWGFSVAASRQLTNNIRVRGQILAKDRLYGDSNLSDRRATVGLVYDSGDGRWSANVDGLYVEGVHCMDPSVNWGAQAGARVKAGPGTVRVHAGYLEASAYELAAAYDLGLGDNLVVSPNVRYTSDLDGYWAYTRAGVEARVRLGNAQAAVK